MDQSEGISMPVLLIVGILGMFLLSVAVILFFTIYYKRMLSQQNALLRLESAYQKGLLNSNIQIQEAERKRIASDLHDSVGSLLSATKLYIKQARFGQSEEKFVHLKKEALGLLDETIVNIRSITQDLLPQSLDRFGLIAAVEDLCERINDLEQIKISFFYNENKRLATEKEVILYRIFQELLNNTLKHSGAENVQIDFEFNHAEFLLKYKDDGKGFDWEASKKIRRTTGGLGMRSIESRAGFLDAELEIKSEINQGVEVIIKLNNLSFKAH